MIFEDILKLLISRQYGDIMHYICIKILSNSVKKGIQNNCKFKLN